MASLTDRPDLLSRLETDGERQAPCECFHEEGDELLPCSSPAEVRVTVVCTAPECDCAVTVHLICRECLVAWQATARADGVRLRVRSL